MKEYILETLKGLVACDSISCTEKELSASDFVYDKLLEIPYFKENPDLVGKYKIPNDAYGRYVVYGAVIGNSKDTVILSGHTDVVSVEVYGEAEPLAFTIGDELEKKLAEMELSDQARADLESGEWIWGRGSADMKAGDVLNLALTKKYAELASKGELKGSVLLLALPDEESYSAGMRVASKIMKKLKDERGLNYRLLIDPEPAAEMGESQVMSIGSVGKVQPVVIAQGEVAHFGHCFDGISALNILSGIYKKTQGSLAFADFYEGEATVPPSWGNMRDMKLCYDVSLPYRGYGFMTVLSFQKTPDDIIDMLRDISENVLEEEISTLNDTYQEFKKINKFATKEKVHFDTAVYTVEELCSELRNKDREKFEKFFEKIYEEAGRKVLEGESYPVATVYMMDELLTYADIKKPLVLIGIAPPYYPATHSNMVEGHEGFGQKVFEFASEISEKEHSQKIEFEHYFLGISDNSYTSVEEMDFERLKSNFPMWGKLYEIDFETIREVSVPSILYGPIGRDYHQWTERVNKRSLLEVMPDMLDRVVNFVWDN